MKKGNKKKRRRRRWRMKEEMEKGPLVPSPLEDLIIESHCFLIKPNR